MLFQRKNDFIAGGKRPSDAVCDFVESHRIARSEADLLGQGMDEVGDFLSRPLEGDIDGVGKSVVAAMGICRDVGIITILTLDHRIGLERRRSVVQIDQRKAIIEPLLGIHREVLSDLFGREAHSLISSRRFLASATVFSSASFSTMGIR